MSDSFDVFFEDTDTFPPLDSEEKAATLPLDEIVGDNNPAPAAKLPVQQGNQNADFDKGNIYKRWYNTGHQSGFLTLRGWLEKGKVSIDIGVIKNNNHDNTLVWCNAIDLAAHLKFMVNTPGMDASEYSFSYYGGSMKDGNAISRIFKIDPWENKDGKVVPGTFGFKCGHFEASKNEQGAFIPKMSKPISTNLIMVRANEIRKISYCIDLALNHFMNTFNGDPLKAIHGDD